MSRPMALALVLMVLFLTSQSEWRASTTFPSRSLQDVSPLATPKQKRLEMHQDAIKEKIILDLMGDVKHLEAENRRLREDRLLLKQQLLRLQLAVASRCPAVSSELLQGMTDVTSGSSVVALSSSVGVSADKDGQSHAEATDSPSATSSMGTTPSGMEASTQTSSSHSLPLRGNAMTSEHLPRDAISGLSSLVRDSVQSSAGQGAASEFEFVHESSSSQKSDTSPVILKADRSLNTPSSEVPLPGATRSMEELAVDKLFRGRSGILGTDRNINSLPLLATSLQSGNEAVAAPGVDRNVAETGNVQRFG